MHIADVNALYDLAKEVPDKALVLAEKFWPGPLTMILKKKDKVPDSITGGLGTVAIRMPSHPVAAAYKKLRSIYSCTKCQYIRKAKSNKGRACN